MTDYSFYHDQLKEHILELVEKGEKVQVYKLRRPTESNMMSCILVFLPAAIIITGDLRVKQHGLQALGYGLDWFKRKLEPSYLAEKFLETEWVPDQARAYLREMQADYRRRLAEFNAEIDPDDIEDGAVPDEPELQKHEWRIFGEDYKDVTIIDALEVLLSDDHTDCFSSPGELYNSLPAYDTGQRLYGHPVYRCPFDISGIGYDYPEHEVGWLAAINQRFAELYSSDQEKTA